MSVELLDTTRFHGFRVRRQIAGKTFQEYFSLKKDGKRFSLALSRTSVKRPSASGGVMMSEATRGHDR